MKQQQLSEYDRVVLRHSRQNMNQAFDLFAQALDRLDHCDDVPTSLVKDLERLKAQRIRIMLKFTKIRNFL